MITLKQASEQLRIEAEKHPDMPFYDALIGSQLASLSGDVQRAGTHLEYEEQQIAEDWPSE